MAIRKADSSSSKKLNRVLARSRHYNDRHKLAAHRHQVQRTHRKLTKTELRQRRAKRVEHLTYLEEKKAEVAAVVFQCAADLHDKHPRHSKDYYVAELLQRTTLNKKNGQDKATDYHAFLRIESRRINDGTPCFLLTAVANHFQ